MVFRMIDFLNAPQQKQMPDLVKSLAQGYQAGLLPRQEDRRQHADDRAERASLLAEQMQKASLGLMPLKQRLLGAQAGEAEASSLLKNMNANRMKEFVDLVSKRSGKGGTVTEDMQEEITSPASPQFSLQPEPYSGQAQQLNYEQSKAPSSSIGASFQDQPQSTTADTVVLEQGNPSLSHLDDIYINNPQYRDLMKGQGFNLSRQIKQDPTTSQIFETTTFPSGKVTAKAFKIGESPESIEGKKARAKEFAKVDAATLSEADNAFDASEALTDNIQLVEDVLNRNKNIMNVAGPLQSTLARWSGNDQDRNTLGTIDSLLGNVVLDAAKSIKGAFTGRDMGLINSIKPNLNDFPAVFQSKLMAMRQINNIVQRRNQLIADYVNKGMSSHDAKTRARKEVDLLGESDKIRSDIARAERIAKFPEALDIQRAALQLNHVGSIDEARNLLKSFPVEKAQKILEVYRGSSNGD